MNRFLEEIKEYRKSLQNNRAGFWEKNKREAEENLVRILPHLMPILPNCWKVYIVLAHFLPYKGTMPHDYDSWSSANLISATEKQGFELLVSFNRARLEFLSAPAQIPLIKHELFHVSQAVESPVDYINSIVNDRLSESIEARAEEELKNLPDIFRQESVLESILYCYDIGGWPSAEKMAHFLYKGHNGMYGGGYESMMKEAEHDLFLNARREGNINLLIGQFDGIK